MIPFVKGAQKKMNQPHTYPVWLWGCSPYQISSPGPGFMEPSDYYDAPIDKVLHFIWDVGLNKRLIKTGSTIDH
jgi:hypothetical protein